MMVRIVSLSVLLTLIVALGVTFFKVLAPFILPLFLAAVFAILCQPIYAYFLERTKNRVRVAAGLTTGAVVSVILIPLIVGTVLAALQLFVVATRLSDRDLGRTWREKTTPVLQFVADFVNARTMPDPTSRIVQPEEPVPFGNDIPWAIDDRTDRDSPDASDSRDTSTITDNDRPSADSPEDDSAVNQQAPSDAVDANADVVAVPPRAPPERLTADNLRLRLQSWIRDSLSDIGGKSLGMAGGTFNVLSDSIVAIGSAALAFVIFAISLYYFLADGTQLVRATERLIPVHVEYQRQMLSQFSKVVRAVVMATFFAALAQAIATVAILWVLGFDHLFIIFIAALLMSMIPMMGTWLVWLPCAIWLFYNGHWFQGLLLTVYGSAFVGMLDNVVRTYILNTDVKLHPLLALISVLGGLQVMGLWGMFVGPIVASCLHALVQIFNHELYALSQERFATFGERNPTPDTVTSPPVTPPPSFPTVAKAAPPAQNAPPQPHPPPATDT